MPNPLSAVMSSPTAATKPESATQKPREAASFQLVMEQGTTAESGEDKLEIIVAQDLEESAEPEVSNPEVELPETPAVSEGQQPVETRLAARDLLTETDEIAPPELASARPQFPGADAGQAVQTQPADANLQTVSPTEQSPPQPSPQLVSSAFTALILGAEQHLRKPETAIPPQTQPAALVSVSAGTRNIQRHLGPVAQPEVPAQPFVAAEAHASKAPERAPTFVQIQLLASDQANVQMDTQQVPDPDDVQPAREVSALSTSRETGTGIQAMTATARAETARAVANQMATAISVRPNSGAIEVALNPEELGRVSIVMNSRDDVLHLTISAERPETLEIMRRHLSVLEAEFQNLGMGDLSFDLGTSADTQDGEPNESGGQEGVSFEAEQMAEAAPTHPKTAHDGRIDIRL